MKLGIKEVFALTAACGVFLGIAGCASEQKPTPTPRDDREQSTAGTPWDQGNAPEPARTDWPFNKSSKTMNWGHLAIPTGQARTSALGIEKGVPVEVRMNQPFEFKFQVTNLTGISLNAVTLMDDLSPGFQVSKSDPQGKAGPSGDMTWELGDFGPHETKIITVTGMATKDGTIGNCASATYAQALCMSIPVVSPKLAVSKMGPAEGSKCDQITYTIEVANTGTGSLTGVKISDPLPAGMTTLDGKQVAEFVVGTLAGGEKRSVTTKVTADKAGKFENKAMATADGGVKAESAVVVTTLREPVLAITKKCPGNAFIGRNLDYEITVTNNGEGVSKNTVIEDTIPAGTTLASASDGGRAGGGKVTWSIGDLAAKGTKTVRFSLTSTAAGTFSNTASVRGACSNVATAQCTATVTGIPAILLEVVDVEDPSQVGSNQTYVITVTNQGSAPGTNIKLVCTLEANQTYVSATGPTAGTGAGSTITFAPLATLAPKDKAIYRVTVKNVKAGDVRFKTSMSSDQLNRPVEETEATNVYE